MDIKVGTKFKTRGKHPKEVTIVDIHTTTSFLSGEVVKVVYVGVHNFMGQQIFGEYPKSSVIMGMEN